MDIAATFDHEPFRHTDPKFFTCCGKMHCKRATKLMFVLCALALIFQILVLAVNFSELTWYTFVIHLAFVVVMAIIVAGLFWALKTENEKLLLPFMIWTVFCILVLLAMLILSFWALGDPEAAPAEIAHNVIANGNSTILEEQRISPNTNAAVRLVSLFLILFSLFCIAVCVWCLITTHKYYLYLKAMKTARVPRNETVEITTINKTINGRQ